MREMSPEFSMEAVSYTRTYMKRTPTALRKKKEKKKQKRKNT